MLSMSGVTGDTAFLTGGGKVGALIREHRWADAPLGEPVAWPQSLRSALSICLHSSFPTAIYWGAELRLLYNDAWAPIPAERHPWALGRPGGEVWADIWHVVGPQFARVLETGEGFSTYDQMLPMVRQGVRRETYWNYSFTAIRGEDGSVVGVFNQGNETTAAVLARRQAEAEIARLGRMFAQAPGAVAVLRGPAHQFEIVNSAYERLVGRHDLVGRTVAEVLPEVIDQGFGDLLDRVFADREPHVGRAVPVTLLRTADGPAERRLLDFVYQPLIDSAGDCSGIFVQATDVTEQHRAEEARELLLHEMNHRVKNLFAVAAGMVTMTARASSSVDEMSEALRGRLNALAKAHDLIRAAVLGEVRHDREVSLRSLVESILEPYAAAKPDPRIAVGGENFLLGGSSVTSFALILHELATNAAKYGALSVPDGRLSIRWKMSDGRLRLDWSETLPKVVVKPPAAQGFGSKLARISATGQLGGSIDFDWQPDGVRIALAVPEGHCVSS